MNLTLLIKPFFCMTKTIKTKMLICQEQKELLNNFHHFQRAFSGQKLFQTGEWILKHFTLICDNEYIELP